MYWDGDKVFHYYCLICIIIIIICINVYFFLVFYVLLMLNKCFILFYIFVTVDRKIMGNFKTVYSY